MESRHDASPQASLSERQPLVLVVDDDPAIRLVCATTLRHDGFDVIEARDGQEGLALALIEAPDLVLLDISMPVLDGFGLAAALRGDERTRGTPVVFLTGERDPRTETRAYEAGAIGFFFKPFDPWTIGPFIRRALTPVVPEPTRAARPGGHAF